MSARGELSPELLSQIAVMPALFPPIISEERLSPIMTEFSLFEMCYFGKTGVKNLLSGFSKPIFSEKKAFFKIFAYSGVFIRPCFVPLRFRWRQ